MGRPINDKSFGVPTVGSPLSLVFSSCWLPTEVAAAANCYIIKQMGSSSYVAENPNTGVTGLVTLVQTITAAGQAVIPVAPSGAGYGAILTPLMGALAGTVSAGGTGYAVGDTLTVTTGTGTSAVFTVSTVASGVVTAVTLTTAGSYSVLPAAGAHPTTTNHAGTGCTISLTSYKIVGVHVAAGGQDYVTATATVSGGTGSGGTISVTVTAGAVTAGTVVVPGVYGTMPIITVNTPVALQTAKKITATRVTTFEGNDYNWHADATVPDATYAALPLFS